MRPMIDLEAIRARFNEAKERFLESVEREMMSNPPRSLSEVVAFAQMYPAAFEDIDALIGEVERLRERDEDWEEWA